MIRKGLICDLDTIYEIELDAFDEPWSRASIEAEFYKDYAEVYVFEKNGTIVGYIIVWYMEKEAELLTIAVGKNHRQAGIGLELVKHAINNGGGGVRWFLEVACQNAGALSLYEKVGFNKVGIIKNYYGHMKDAFRMALEVNAPEG